MLSGGRVRSGAQLNVASPTKGLKKKIAKHGRGHREKFLRRDHYQGGYKKRPEIRTKGGGGVNSWDACSTGNSSVRGIQTGKRYGLPERAQTKGERSILKEGRIIGEKKGRTIRSTGGEKREMLLQFWTQGK